jgi:predicted DNA-binding transcriptional regulator AlpA
LIRELMQEYSLSKSSVYRLIKVKWFDNFWTIFIKVWVQ